MFFRSMIDWIGKIIPDRTIVVQKNRNRNGYANLCALLVMPTILQYRCPHHTAWPLIERKRVWHLIL